MILCAAPERRLRRRIPPAGSLCSFQMIPSSLEEHHALSKRSRAAARRAAGGPAGLSGRRLSVYPPGGRSTAGRGESAPGGRRRPWPATGPFSGTTPPVWAWTSCPPAIFSPQRASSGFSPWAAGACWSHSPAPERSTLRRSFFAVPSLRLPPHGPLCYNGRESEARYP